MSADVDAPDPFPNYLAMPSRVSLRFWHAVRFASIAGLLGVAMSATIAPDDTLTLFWGVIVPVLPAVFLIAPGLWRNVCPLAGVNQASRYLGVTSQQAAPRWLREHGFTIATALFVTLVLLRKITLNRNGPALAAVLVLLLVGAGLGGRYLRGKSGWCSSICPLLPVQRVYGQSPFVGVPNSHCRPCLGCTKNCYDFNPRVAYVADMHDPDQGFRGPRRLFVGAFPGLVLGYFLVPDTGQIGVLEMLGRVGLYVAATVAVFAVLDNAGRFSPNTLPPLFGGTAFALFYWFGSQRVANSLGSLVGGDWQPIVIPVRVAAIALAAVWLVRSWRVQQRYVESVAAPVSVQVDLGRARSALASRGVSADGTVEVQFGERIVVVRAGTTLLEAAESADLPIESGCRMGVCGADPVAVLDGYDSLSPMRREEVDTLKRLGLGAPNRMACVARAEHGCAVSLTPDRTAASVDDAPTFRPDPDVRQVVIIGNGIGGVTAADFVRRNHPDCEITIIGREPHRLYNRMGVARLIHGRSAMQGLYLVPDNWYEQHRINLWLNTRAIAIDREHQEVRLGIGDSIRYDRLILATGGRASVPEIEQFGMPGCFVLREADDAIRIRAYAQDYDEQRAVVAGGGLLGLEAAHALHELGMSVTVFERSPRLLRNALDPTASEILRSYFESVGIAVVTETETARVEGDGRLQEIVTATGQRFEAEVLLVAAGVTPNIELAERAGLTVQRGVVVDEHLRTSDPAIYAVGDLAEFGGRLWGLWPVAVEQAQIAAVNVAGGERVYTDEIPTVILKGVGLDVVSFGRVDADEGMVLVVERGDGHTYRRIVLDDGAVVGGVFLGFNDDAQRAQDARSLGRRLDDGAVERLIAGDWSVLDLQRVPT